MNRIELAAYLAEKCMLNLKEIRTETIEIRQMTLIQLRDAILTNGWRILFEDLEQQVYISSIKGGFFKMNKATVALHIEHTHLQIAMYAREGIINQHTCEDVRNEIKRAFEKR